MLHAPLYAGVDIGGTKTLMMLAGADGVILSEWRTTSDVETEPETFFAAILGSLRAEASRLGHDPNAIQGIGFGFPGVIGPQGILTHAPAFPWREAAVAEILRKQFDGAIYLDNDVNAAALGEQWQGAARGIQDFLMVTVGTGIGGALFLDGRIYRGAGAAAGELGYSVLAAPVTQPAHSASPASSAPGAPADGNAFGQFEDMASGSGIGRLAREYLAQLPNQGRTSRIAQLAGNDPAAVDARHVLTAAGQDDPEALQVLQQPLDYMAIGVANAVSLLNPAMVVIGGGVADSGEWYVTQIRERVKKLTPIETKIARATLGNRAGAMGALAGVLPRPE
ncbi:ROK family protein [Paenibacillus daejeonensis]|uniref:ROK family protein n=1 Tax=Paenibacillus daejeonensis TaxID=135193 RepID=UPI000372306B|nr:ROK family protein [Paenibacillus daejeonensis]